jgi:hypothetical protein
VKQIAGLTGFFLAIFGTGISAAGLATAVSKGNEAGAAGWALLLVIALTGFAAMWKWKRRRELR